MNIGKCKRCLAETIIYKETFVLGITIFPIQEEGNDICDRCRWNEKDEKI